MQPRERGLCSLPACFITLTCLVVLSASAAADHGAIISPGAGATLMSGQRVSIDWHELPAKAEEMEILLVLDHGTVLRLTHQRSARATTYSWLVPNLPSRDARLQLRYGHDGVEHECLPSEPFAIIASLSEPLAAIAYHAGEWWLGKIAAVNPAGSVSGEPTRIGALPATATMAVLPVSDQLASAARQQSVSLAKGVPNAAADAPADYGLTRQPMDIPLRP